MSRFQQGSLFVSLSSNAKEFQTFGFSGGMKIPRESGHTKSKSSGT